MFLLVVMIQIYLVLAPIAVEKWTIIGVFVLVGVMQTHTVAELVTLPIKLSVCAIRKEIIDCNFSTKIYFKS